MGFKFDFSDETLMKYVGKKVKIVFAGNDVMICKVLGFTSAADNDDGVATIDVSCSKYDACVGISENEIVGLTLLE